MELEPAMLTGSINTGFLEGRIDELSLAFKSAAPFPHVSVDGMVQLSDDDMARFPTSDWSHWNSLGDKYQINKLSCDDIDAIPEPFASIIRESSQPRFLRALQKLTGVEKVIPDPYLSGGGLHLSGPGGILGPHTDFHIYRNLDLYRQINVIFYLNPDWHEADGGSLTLFDGKEAAVKIVPVMGRMAVFITDDQSVHGFPVPVAEGKWRRSIALYYYTARESSQFSGDETTLWREHGNATGLAWKFRLLAYKALINISRGVSVLAHLANPNQGLGLVATILRNKAKDKKKRAL